MKRLLGYLREIDSELMVTDDPTAKGLSPHPCMEAIDTLGDVSRSVTSILRKILVASLEYDIPPFNSDDSPQGLEEGKTHKGGINLPPTRPRPRAPAPAE